MAAERRNYDFKEIRTVASSKEKIIEGHAAVFNQRTNIDGSFYEVIERGAFDGCDLSDVALLVNHDNGQIPLARTTSGTLTVTVDDIGLAIRANLDTENNSAAQALYSAVSRGDLKGMSFCFSIDELGDEWRDIEAPMPTRRIKRIKKCYECSAVTYPAYSTTDIQARAKLEKAKELHKMNFEEFIKQYKDADERTAIVNYAVGLMPDGKTSIPAEFRDMVPAKFTVVKKAENQPPSYIPGKGFIPAEQRNITSDKVFEERTQAGDLLKDNKAVQSPFNAIGEMRTMTINPVDGNASIIVPTYTSANIKPDFPVVSSIIDAVGHLSLPGGDSYKQPYVTGITAGNYTGEGEDYADVGTSFEYAQINRCKVTAYAELTEEFEKLPSAAYADLVFRNIRQSIREVLAKEILFGKGLSDDGTQHRLVGIFSERATAISSDSDISISQISDTTLDDIVLKYGGAENAESPAVLLLNKLDLLAFSKVRTSTKQKFYDIHLNGSGGGGNINGVPFILSSALKPLTVSESHGGAAVGDYCMCYGNPANYQLVEFSPLQVKKSDDFKFRAGITCFRGSVFVGGNCVKHNAFLRIKRG